MSRSSWLVSTLAVIPLALAALIGPAAASAEVQFGTLSNFDVFNDTGEETHGFEIELDGVSSSDISYTFGAPYQYRYGTPTMENFAGGVYVRYASPYDAGKKEFLQGTPLAPTPITPTMGHQCWTGGSAGYLTAGCEHFGARAAEDPDEDRLPLAGREPGETGNADDRQHQSQRPDARIRSQTSERQRTRARRQGRRERRPNRRAARSGAPLSG